MFFGSGATAYSNAPTAGETMITRRVSYCNNRESPNESSCGWCNSPNAKQECCPRSSLGAAPYHWEIHYHFRFRFRPRAASCCHHSYVEALMSVTKSVGAALGCWLCGAGDSWPRATGASHTRGRRRVRTPSSCCVGGV